MRLPSPRLPPLIVQTHKIRRATKPKACSSSSCCSTALTLRRSHHVPPIHPFLITQIHEIRRAAKPKTYSYYYLGPEVGAARSSGGGVSLLVKNP